MGEFIIITQKLIHKLWDSDGLLEEPMLHVAEITGLHCTPSLIPQGYNCSFNCRSVLSKIFDLRRLIRLNISHRWKCRNLTNP
jgi:hypothetical protein